MANLRAYMEPRKDEIPGLYRILLKYNSHDESFDFFLQTLGAFTLLTSRFLKSRHFDHTIYTCAKNREVSVSRFFGW